MIYPVRQRERSLRFVGLPPNIQHWGVVANDITSTAEKDLYLRIMPNNAAIKGFSRGGGHAGWSVDLITTHGAQDRTRRNGWCPSFACSQHTLCVRCTRINTSLGRTRCCGQERDEVNDGTRSLASTHRYRVALATIATSGISQTQLQETARGADSPSTEMCCDGR